MKTEKEILEIERKIKAGEPLEPHEWCEGFSIVDGVADDSKIHDDDSEWDKKYFEEYFKRNPS